MLTCCFQLGLDSVTLSVIIMLDSKLVRFAFSVGCHIASTSSSNLLMHLSYAERSESASIDIDYCTKDTDQVCAVTPFVHGSSGSNSYSSHY